MFYSPEERVGAWPYCPVDITKPFLLAGNDAASPFKALKIALIADEPLRVGLSAEARIFNVTPHNYKFVLKFWKPDVLLVESAWFGYFNTWRYRIAAYPDRKHASNRLLRRVCAAAADLNIPAVFWNKEDAAGFERFIDSAQFFDCILTTDANTLPRYRRKLGMAKKLGVQMFAVQPRLHAFRSTEATDRRACFAGSFVRHYCTRRIQNQEMLFGATQDVGLTVFDRNSHRSWQSYRFPQAEHMEIRKRVPYARTPQIFNAHLMSLNVNTVENSPTMFSRRLIEIIASGGLAVTTPSLAVSKHFADFCHVVSDPVEARELAKRLKQGRSRRDIEMIRAGADDVRRNFTYKRFLENVMDLGGSSSCVPGMT